MLLLRNIVVLALGLMVWLTSCASVLSFGVVHPTSPRHSKSTVVHAQPSDSDALKKEAAELLERARALRATLPDTNPTKDAQQVVPQTSAASPWTVPDSDRPGVGYRLYLDIGREEGTWMDPRWGASGRRIEFSVDVKFMTESPANQTVASQMVHDNFGGRSSPVFDMESSRFARLRSGFDRMACYGGGYRIDSGKNGAGTTRFHIVVDGTPERGSSNGYVRSLLTKYSTSKIAASSHGVVADHFPHCALQ